MIQSRQPTIPRGYEDLLRSTALAHVATIGPAASRRTTPSG